MSNIKAKICYIFLPHKLYNNCFCCCCCFFAEYTTKNANTRPHCVKDKQEQYCKLVLLLPTILSLSVVCFSLCVFLPSFRFSLHLSFPWQFSEKNKKFQDWRSACHVMSKWLPSCCWVSWWHGRAPYSTARDRPPLITWWRPACNAGTSPVCLWLLWRMDRSVH